MKKTFRVLAWLFAAIAAWRLYSDVMSTIGQGREYRMRQAGEVWAMIHRDSLLAAQPAVERYLSPRLWENVLLPILEAPLFAMLVGLSIFFFIASAPRFKLR